MYRIDTQSGRGDKESINPHVRLVIKIFVENEGVPKKKIKILKFTNLHVGVNFV